MSILEYTALELAAQIRKKEISCREAVEAVFGQIEKQEEGLNCYISLDREEALRQADAAQKGIGEGTLAGPLAGVPAAVKDNICTAGRRTTCASRILSDFIPPCDAFAVKKLKEAGCILIGKTNMDEFAMGSTSETGAFGSVRNPWDRTRAAGGSSGGSAAAVAAGECFLALGSDTGGSIRQPAGFCGIVGMKPTYGTVSRNGLIAYGSSLDQIGPLCRDAADCAALLEAISGKDRMDSTSMERRTDFTAALTEGVKGLRIGIPKDYFSEGLDEEVKKAVLQAAQKLAQLGAQVEEFDLSLTEYAVPAYYTIASAEASSNLERFDGVKYGYRTPEYEGLHDMYKRTRSEGFGTEVKRRIMLGSFVLSSGYYDAYYLKALRVKAMIRKAFDEAFSRFDCILGPVAPAPAPLLGESLKDPIRMYLGDIYTISANLAGIPGISLPCGLTADGLPIGVQLMADCFQEKKLLRAAHAYEQARGSFPLCPALQEEIGYDKTV